MTINSKHPQYVNSKDDWEICRDSYRGQSVVKAKGTTYLPATSGMETDGMGESQPGRKAYEAYKKRALFPDHMSQAVETMIGMMWTKPPVIELPAAMEGMREDATVQHESLEQLLRRINEQQLVTGRLGLLLDVPATETVGDVLPYIATYEADAIINWDDGARNEVDKDTLNMVVLDESEYVRDADFSWRFQNKYRVLMLGDPFANEVSGNYSVGVFDQNATFAMELMSEPSIRGNMLDKIPFVFVNSKDVVAKPDDPPLLGLAELCMAIYRGEADYRQSLFLQGQDTLVIIGNKGEEDYRVGAGAALSLPMGADAKFIGVSSEGLAEQRSALENDKALAHSKSGQVVDNRTRTRESGDALDKRIGAQTASLSQVALTGAFALEKVLKIGAEWVGANPDEVSVKPNMDFVRDTMVGKELVELVTAKTMGAPLSKRSVHSIMKKRELTDMEYEDELREIDEEEPMAIGGDGGVDEEPADAENV